jgi:hypothetical protein
VSRILAIVMSIVVVATLFMDATFFNDPCEGNVYLEQLNEERRLKRLQENKNCDPLTSDNKS